MRLLGIETSCDETGAAVIEGNPGDKTVKLLSNVVASSISLHAKTGGIIPEVAAREQLKYIIPVVEQALRGSTRGVDAQNPAGLLQSAVDQLDAIAVTIGPGLIGSLLVGVETAKTLAYVWKKPIIPVNHLIGHIYANFIRRTDDRIQKTDRPQSFVFSPPNFPALALIVSGGHTDLILMKNHQWLIWIGGTRDDAAGEAFDKIGRLLGFPYPGGPAIAAAAAKSQISNLKSQIRLPRPMLHEDNFDFSFSGLKTAVAREVNRLKTLQQYNNTAIQQLAFETQQAIVDVLVAKTLRAAQNYNVKSILLSGGVAANENLRKQMHSQLSALSAKLYAPPAHLCTDNAAMIATAAFFNYKPLLWKRMAADPSLHFDTHYRIDRKLSQ